MRICPEELPGRPIRGIEARLGDDYVEFVTEKGTYRLKADTIAELARASYHFAKKLLKGKVECVEPVKGGEPFKGIEDWKGEEGFARAVEFMVLTLSPTFSKLYGKISKVSYDPGTEVVEWST